MPKTKKLHWAQTPAGIGQMPEKVEGQPLSEVTQATLAGYSKPVDKPSNSYVVRIERPDRTVIEVIERNY